MASNARIVGHLFFVHKEVLLLLFSNQPTNKVDLGPKVSVCCGCYRQLPFSIKIFTKFYG